MATLEEKEHCQAPPDFGQQRTDEAALRAHAEKAPDAG